MRAIISTLVPGPINVRDKPVILSQRQVVSQLQGYKQWTQSQVENKLQSLSSDSNFLEESLVGSAQVGEERTAQPLVQSIDSFHAQNEHFHRNKTIRGRKHPCGRTGSSQRNVAE